MNIRTIIENDSEQFLLLCKSLDCETQFMMLEPGERTLTVDAQHQRIQNLLASDNQVVFVVEEKNQLVGYLGAYGGGYRRNRHSAYIVTGILNEYAGRGLGKRLFEALNAWAADHQIHRLELTVMCHNERAVHLYQKMGFEIEGVKRDSLRVDGRYVDEYYMARIL